MLLEMTLRRIGSLDAGAMEKAQRRLDSLIKPPGSLGVLEEMAVRLAGITGDPKPQVRNKTVIVMAGDHGVVAEGVSVAPQQVTAQMLPAFVGGVAGIGVLARHAGARLVVVDVGVAVPVEFPGVLQRKVRAGTGNIAVGPAMSREEAVRALETGIEVAQEEIERGAGLLAVGDMGIGNTTPSSAILAAFGGYTAEEVAGRGTMVNDQVLKRKIGAIARALQVNRPDPQDALDVLSKVGGLEIAGLAGVILGAAAGRVPVLIDGFITTAAALVAYKLQPKTREFMIASHLSEEQGHRLMLEQLNLTPVIHMKMRLGEGTGAALTMHLVEAATRIIREMASFDEAGVSALEEDKILK
ncbi:MAG: nicotinate-nucleotide--dimethylbenzimidazole phosphoribosyltransferase [Pelotomaculum sp.]|uniref:Nicotinate-nucleotide--dimethylbenzimidazole phosphoribosyltransferase n=1 Tax=Pelotomaculum thermopropionicum (strain DSM 13744 / JCM 10971 / SI) TaxID=370438 RepID=A5D3Q8_PELTS|nr:nicotinate-nucleotide--dimethylbenzimidazole phosphoribosyltransferase [Pelotomaculum sp.]BAF59112.1 NaMN:DMB phosphoribosyltransferase [Pelotomaculum thermopropionicum SI]